ncbi:MAG TPA: cytochrome C oxidase subunit IV family protein [Polyangiaceae bacterium]|nr:cytochrome C oxidase subunit IV family protein [Polyangiaceae bacterium]
MTDHDETKRPITPPTADDGHAHALAPEHHGLAHVTPLSLLLGIFAALVVLTVVTVAVTKVDLGAQGNLVVAMIIATIKAGLVVTYFMHLRWDRTFHTLLFLGSLLFVLLFLGLALTDRQEYQPLIDAYRDADTAS